jgi:hypothetical protein
VKGLLPHPLQLLLLSLLAVAPCLLPVGLFFNAPPVNFNSYLESPGSLAPCCLQPFSLGQQRGIAAALNTLVFRTQLPDCSGGGASSPGPALNRRSGAASSLGREYSLLQQAAPLLHRALYERDARRQFCPPALWLEPYQHLISSNGSGQQQPLSGAAVVRALLAAAGDDGDAAERHQQHGQGPMAAVAAAAAAAASRPAAVAAILTAAPQCVPFEERVAVFRALIDTDRER